MIRRILPSIEHFFFRRENALGLGLMRSAWGAAVLFSLLVRAPFITQYYTDMGFWPPEIMSTLVRASYRFSLLDYVHDPRHVALLFAVLTVTSITAMVGLLPRLSVFATVGLLFSFHERNYLPLAGGDTVLRLTGFILLISPGIGTFSVQRLKKQWRNWKLKGRLLADATAPVWPSLLVTWQLLVIYISSGWYKLYGSNWLAGTAVAFPLKSPLYARFDSAFFDSIPYFYLTATYLTLIFEALWLLLLVPPALAERIPFFRSGRLRRWILISGILFHLGILITMQVGTFSYTMFALYFGMIRQGDIDAMRSFFRKISPAPVTMLFDGHCRLCRKIAFQVRIFDWLDRVRFADIRDAAQRKKFAPAVTLKELDRVVHVRMKNGTLEKSFSAVRIILSRLPINWPLIPLMWFPGVRFLTTPVYDFIASRRPRCTDESCRIR